MTIKRANAILESMKLVDKESTVFESRRQRAIQELVALTETTYSEDIKEIYWSYVKQVENI